VVKEQELRHYIADEIMEQPFYIPTYFADHITVEIFKAVLQERQKNAYVVRNQKND
jgi:hypothetical protein